MTIQLYLNKEIDSFVLMRPMHQNLLHAYDVSATCVFVWCQCDCAQASVCVRVHRLLPPADPRPWPLMQPHWAANWIRLTGTIDNRQDAAAVTELPLNLAVKELTLSFSPRVCLCVPPSPLAGNSDQKGEDVSKQRLPVLAAARKTQRHHPRLWDQILRKGGCRTCRR